MTFWKWQQSAASNSTADPSCPWPEGMAPSQVNDSARGNMAALAKYRDDIAGITATSGTSTAYAFTTSQQFDSLAHMANAMIAFVPHVTNAGACTLNVDGLGAQPLHISPGTDLPAGTIIAGTPYAATYYNSGQWILHGLYGQPYSIPLLGGIDYWGFSTPNSSFIFPVGQAISRTVYAAAFAQIGTFFGAGDGSTTFNIPDMRGRVAAVADNMSAGGIPGAAAGRLSLGFSGTGGSQTQMIAQANLPAVAISVGGSTSGYSPTVSGVAAVAVASGAIPIAFTATGGNNTFQVTAFSTLSGFSSLSVSGNTSNLGSGAALTTLPPTIACNYILRIV